QAPGGGGRQMRGEQRLAGEGDQRAQQAHLDHGGQQGGDGRGRRGAQHRGPEDHGGSQQAQLHQPVGAVVRQGPAVGGRRVPHPEHQGLNGGGGRQRQRRVAPAVGPGHNDQRRGGRDPQGGVDEAGREQGRGQGAQGGNEGQNQEPARGRRPNALTPAGPPAFQHKPAGRDRQQSRQQPRVEVPASQPVSGRGAGPAIGQPGGGLGHGDGTAVRRSGSAARNSVPPRTLASVTRPRPQRESDMARIERERGFGGWAAVAVGVLFGLIGLVLTIGGGWLIAVGGSWYYLLAGLGLIASGALLVLGRLTGVWLYAAIFGLTVLWALWEVGLNGWALLPRVFAPLVLLIVAFALIPALTPARTRRPLAGLAWGALGVFVLVGGLAVFLANRAGIERQVPEA